MDESASDDAQDSVETESTEPTGTDATTEPTGTDATIESTGTAGEDAPIVDEKPLLDAETFRDAFDIETIRSALDASGNEQAALERVRLVARLLDEAVRVPGTDYRVGLDPILGILPGAGDAVAAALSLYPVVEAARLGASKGTLAKMLFLVAADFTVGSVPVLGTIFDAVWKANEWNADTVEKLVENA